jgi:hypothetical protein
MKTLRNVSIGCAVFGVGALIGWAFLPSLVGELVLTETTVVGVDLAAEAEFAAWLKLSTIVSVTSAIYAQASAGHFNAQDAWVAGSTITAGYVPTAATGRRPCGCSDRPIRGLLPALVGLARGLEVSMSTQNAIGGILFGLVIIGVSLAFRRWGDRLAARGQKDFTQRSRTNIGMIFGFFLIAFGVIELVRVLSK